MLVRLCGVRGSTPAPGAEFVRYGGHTSCVAVTHDADTRPTLILDAGTGIRTVSPLLGGQPYEGVILLSHLHWDHFQGLPFFAAADHPDARVQVLVPDPGDGTGAADLLARSMSPPHFPLRPEGLRGSWSFDTIEPGHHRIAGFEVLAREIPHKGGRTFGYRVDAGGAAFAYMPDHCPTALGAGPDGCGEYHEAAIELADSVAALIHDAQLMPEELAEEARFGHASYEYPLGLARRAGAREVILFHHRPDRTDETLEGLQRGLAGGPPRVRVGAQGDTLEL